MTETYHAVRFDQPEFNEKCWASDPATNRYCMATAASPLGLCERHLARLREEPK